MVDLYLSRAHLEKMSTKRLLAYKNAMLRKAKWKDKDCDYYTRVVE